jgi:GntR family transcriptional regulator
VGRGDSQPDELHVIVAAMSHLYEQVRAQLIEGISAGQWRAGEAIPTEARLAERFGVAIGTVRKAVDSLVAEQALIRRQGKGTYVTAHDDSRLLFHFFHVVARDGAKTYPDVRTVDFRRERADAESAAALAIAPLEKVIRIRNVLSLEGAPVIVDDITLPAELFRGLTEKIFLARGNTIYHLYQSRYGINVLRTDERLRAVPAPRDIAQQLQVAGAAPLLEIRRVALTFRDRPVELRLSRVNTARHDYHNTLGKQAA